MRGCCPIPDGARAFSLRRRLSIIVTMNEGVLLPIFTMDVAPSAPLADALLALNNEHAQELSWLEPTRLAHLVQQSFLARRVGEVDAFLLAFDQDADYDSPNFLWFREHYPRFVYVDASWSPPLRAAAGWRACSIASCSRSPRARDIAVWFARSIRRRPILYQMHFMQR